MGKLRHLKLAGSTLVEVLIAMVIIMVVFSIAIGLFSNVLSGGVSMRKVQIHQQMESLRIQVAESQKIEEDHVQIDSIDYQLSTIKQAHSDMDILEIKASDHGKPAGSIRALIKLKNDEQKD